jgi:hypothetical protein
MVESGFEIRTSTLISCFIFIYFYIIFIETKTCKAHVHKMCTRDNHT